MLFKHGNRDYSIDDSWWHESGIASWARVGTSYTTGADRFRGKDVTLIDIDSVEPLTRNLSHGVFNDSKEFGTARARVTRILRGFAEGAALPPLELVENSPSRPHRFRLFDGAHRFYCAVAVGFSKVPAIVYSEREIQL